MTAQDPDRLTLADVARLPDYVQRAIARTIDPTLPAEPSAARVTLPPTCPECGGPADTGAGHDCERSPVNIDADRITPPEPMAQYDADRAALARAYARETDAIFAREARRARDYDDGIIADDDH